MTDKIPVVGKIKNNPLIKKLLSLKLPSDDYAIFGSGPMFAHGIKDLDHDIDLVSRDKAWEKAKQLGKVEKCQMEKMLLNYLMARSKFIMVGFPVNGT